ncbi:hypothetical protein X943_001406 [Babesia divergens]|uniref:Small ribosomal subunit protein uS10 domain-containing protein n=1 Tax=Babesia divergens TaxID=32595 RepID=A0AAD9G6U6_BABDI|nr:hypothetical protein X943_001406 [Babesia divergens]
MFLVLSLYVSVASAIISRSRHDVCGASPPIAESRTLGDSFVRGNRRLNWQYGSCAGAAGSLVPCFTAAGSVRQLPGVGRYHSAFQVVNGFSIHMTNGVKSVCLLNAKSTGTKEARRQWHMYLNDVDDAFVEDPDAPEHSDIEEYGNYVNGYNAAYADDSSIEPEVAYGNGAPMEPAAAEPTQTSRFGTPRFMESTSRILDAAKSKLKDLFSWNSSTTDEQDIGDGKGEAEGPRPFHSTVKYKDEELLRLPYVMSRDVNMNIEKWPENCFLRIRLVSYYPYLLKLSANRIIRGIRENTNLRVGNVKAMPMRKKRWCLLSSPHVDKRSKDLFEIQEHVRFLDVFPKAKKVPAEASSNKSEDDSASAVGDTASLEDGKEAPEASSTSGSRWNRVDEIRSSGAEDEMKFKGLLMVPLPSMVSFDYWFEEAHKPVKNRSIDKVFRRRIWISKYFLHNYEKREKAELIDKLTSPDLYQEIPLRWKKHPCDYFACQLGELRKLYNFVVARKAEDEARKRYGVKEPELLDIDEVRFIPNEEDRRCGYISSDDEDDEDIAKELAALDSVK